MSSYGSRRPDRQVDWLVASTVAVCWALVFALVLAVKPGGDTGVTWFDDVALLLTALVAATVAVIAARRDWGTRRGLAWAFIAAGLLANAFGEAAWGVQELALGKEDVFPSVADAGYLGLYVPVFLGLLLMPQAPASGLRRLKMSLDVLIGLGAVAAVSSVLVVDSVLDDSGATTLERVIGLAYPLADIGVVFAVLVLLGRTGRSPAAGALVFLALGFACIALSDSLYTYLSYTGDYASGSYIDAGWVAGYGFVTLAAAMSAYRGAGTDAVVAEREEPAFVWQPLAMYAPVAPMGGVLIVDHGLRDGPLFVMFILIAGVMFLRQFIAHLENVSLNRRLADQAVQLEQKVRTQSLELWKQRGGAGSEKAAPETPAVLAQDWME